MKRLLIVCGLMLVLAGCSATSKDVALTSYKALDISATVYDTAMLSLSDLHKQGVLTDEQWVSVKDAARVFTATYREAVDALVSYMNASDAAGKERLLSYVDVAKHNLSMLLTLLEGFGIDLTSLGLTSDDVASIKTEE